MTHHERAVRVLESRVGGQNRVVGLNNRAGKLGCGIHAELELRLFAIVSRESLKKKRAQSRPSSTPKGMEDEEALETRAVVGQPPQFLHHGVDKLFANGVVSTRI